MHSIRGPHAYGLPLVVVVSPCALPSAPRRSIASGGTPCAAAADPRWAFHPGRTSLFESCHGYAPPSCVLAQRRNRKSAARAVRAKDTTPGDHWRYGGVNDDCQIRRHSPVASGTAFQCVRPLSYAALQWLRRCAVADIANSERVVDRISRISTFEGRLTRKQSRHSCTEQRLLGGRRQVLPVCMPLRRPRPARTPVCAWHAVHRWRVDSAAVVAYFRRGRRDRQPEGWVVRTWIAHGPMSHGRDHNNAQRHNPGKS